jgi:hypothetical protein
VIRYLTEDHDRIAQRMNDVVVRRIFAAGLVGTPVNSSVMGREARQ